MKPDQEFIKKYTELYGDDIQFGQTSENIVAGTVGEDGKFYAVDSITSAGKKQMPKKKPILKSDAAPTKSKSKRLSAGRTPQEELFQSVQDTLKEEFTKRIQAGGNPFDEFKMPESFFGSKKSSK